MDKSPQQTKHPWQNPPPLYLSFPKEKVLGLMYADPQGKCTPDGQLKGYCCAFSQVSIPHVSHTPPFLSSCQRWLKPAQRAPILSFTSLPPSLCIESMGRLSGTTCQQSKWGRMVAFKQKTKCFLMFHGTKRINHHKNSIFFDDNHHCPWITMDIAFYNKVVTETASSNLS